MFGALSRWFKAFGYLLTGQLDAARRTLDTNPFVMRAKYDEIITDKISRIQQYKQAVSGLIAQQENKMAKVKALTEEVEKLERLKAGALAKAKQQVEKLQAAGKDPEAVKQDEDYKKCLSAYNDFSSTLAEKKARIEELEQDIAGYAKRIGDHKVQLQALAREIDKIKSEAHDAVADMITSTQEKEVADAISGIAEDGTEKELQRLRDLRQQVRAEVRVSRELAGTDAKAQEAEFLEYARTSETNNEFESLVGLAASKDAAAAAGDQAVKEKSPALPD
jgi:chromosome segregation ATPase